MNALLGGKSTKESVPEITDQLNQFCQSINKDKFDSIMCVAGGFSMGNIKDHDIFDQVEKMHNMNVVSSVLTAHLASKYLANNGLLLFTGAALPFQEPTPQMLAYGLSKTATHSISLNMAKRQEIPSDSVVTCILPGVIDTPQNREAMPDADQKDWTSPASMAGLLKMWAEGTNRPQNGSFSILKNNNGMVIPEFV